MLNVKCFKFLLPLALLLTGCQTKQPVINIIRDLEYATYQHQGETKQLLLDLYLPVVEGSQQPQPLLIYIHGGGWLEFSKEICPGEIVAKKGYAIACINYRYSTEAIFPAQIHDAKAAVRWLRANATQYNLDPSKFGAWGASAGGHLSLLLGTSGGVAELEGNQGNLDVSSEVQAVCNWFAPTDFTQVPPAFSEPFNPEIPQKYRGVPWLLYTKVTYKLLGGAVAENLELAALANPITYIDSKDPPVLVVHGELDKIVPISQSEILVEALEDKGVPVTFVRKSDMTHSYRGANKERFSPELIGMALAFFEENL
ncbi:MAG: alpha/beta hydrolase [Xenococcaceae cyanobacterium MO_207.B15]|nr:alpha/beta hydrolase [Xenococcaceae cyanobacterium MO_207.B15]MDJ0746919.1 alpha/beta hydrolase [Xenococcaceae cyanobacterium MO_167.B27]